MRLCMEWIAEARRDAIQMCWIRVAAILAKGGGKAELLWMTFPRRANAPGAMRWIKGVKSLRRLVAGAVQAMEDIISR
jgi:hypothetical protein